MPVPAFDASRIVQIAQAAGEAILAIYQRPDIAAWEKGDRSPLTEADLASHRLIVEQLAIGTPEIPVLSEESAPPDPRVRQAWPAFWLVDPLDGTKEFLKRNDEFTVNIALVVEGRPTWGVVHAPVLGRSWWGGLGQGAWCSDQGGTRQIRVAGFPDDGRWSVMASRSHRGEAVDRFLATLGEHTCLARGSSLKLCEVAAGQAHCYPRLGPTMEWDTAAAEAVVVAAGGTVCDRLGQALRYNKTDLHNPWFLALGAAYPGLPEATRSALSAMNESDA
jgi:3'(2'), 5'-bisphosphate nucleotidase